MRTPKQSSIVIEKTIKEIRNTKGVLTNKTIERICLKNNINQKLIRQIAGWQKEKTKIIYD